MKGAWRGQPWRLGGLGLLVAIGLGLALLAERGELKLTIYTDSGAGTIRADRIWEQGGRLWWEARGSQGCVAKGRVILPPRASVSGPGPAPARPRRELEGARAAAGGPAWGKQQMARAAWAVLETTRPRFSTSQCLATEERTAYGWGPGAGPQAVGNRQSPAGRTR